jgi:hypothetical protein
MQTKPRELIRIFTFSIPSSMLHSSLQAAPVTLHISIFIIRTLMKVRQLYVL